MGILIGGRSRSPEEHLVGEVEGLSPDKSGGEFSEAALEEFGPDGFGDWN